MFLLNILWGTPISEMCLMMEAGVVCRGCGALAAVAANVALPWYAGASAAVATIVALPWSAVALAAVATSVTTPWSAGHVVVAGGDAFAAVAASVALPYVHVQ